MPPPMCLQEIEINNKPPHIINWWKNYLFVISDGTIEIIYSDNLRNFSKLKKFENIKEINSNHIKSFIFVKNIKDQNQDEFTDFYETEGLLIISNSIPDNDKQDEILTILIKMKINLTTPTTDINRIEFLEVTNYFRRKFDKLSCMFNSTMSDNLFEKKSYEDKLSSLQINTIQIENKQKDLNLIKKNTGQGTNQDTWENLQRNDFENLDIDNYYNKKEHDDLNNDEDNLFSNLGIKNAKFDIAKLHKSTDINLNQPHPAGNFKIHFFAVVNKNKEKEISKIQISLNTNLLNDNNNSNQEDKIMQINYEQESIASSNYDIVKAHSVIIKNDENTNTLDEKVVYLTRNNRLYLNNNYLAADTTSFEIFKNFLIFTQSSNSPYNILHILDMAKPESLNLKQQINKNDPIFTPNFNYKHFSMRTLERTSLIVSVSKNNIIVQLARGNIETFYPRILVLDSVVESVSNRKYLEAFELVRKNKINPNFLYDIDPEGFFFNIESFVKQINKIDYINLFINCLENNLCEEIQQLDNKIITKEDFKKLYIENKINKICDALRKELIKINENDKYITSIIHTHTKKTPSEYLEALRLIQSIKLKENETKSADDIFNLNKAHKKHKNADQALEYLCWVVNAEILFDFSLKTFDFELVILVAKYTQKDPKEYLPYLKKLQEMDPILMKYQINIDLKYYEDALFELSKSEEKYFDKSIELINKHELYELAFTLFSKNQNLLKTVFENYGRNLKTKKKFFEAGYAFLSNNNYPEALECFIENGSIIEILKILPKLNIQKTEEEIEKIFLEVIDITTSARKYNEIEKLLSYLESNPQYQKYSILSKLIDSLIRGKRFHLVLSIYLMENNKLDTKLKSEFLDSLSLCANLKSNELKKNIILFEEKYCRLLKVQHQKRLNPQLFSLDNKELEDNVSDSGSIISSSSKKSSKSKKTTSSRLTKKSQAKMSKRNVKEGSPLEEDFLIMIISELFLSEDHVNEINNLVNVLYLLGKSDEGKELSFVLKEYLKKINPNTKIYNVIQQDFLNKYPEIKEIFPNTFNVAKLESQKNLITKD